MAYVTLVASMVQAQRVSVTVILRHPDPGDDTISTIMCEFVRDGTFGASLYGPLVGRLKNKDMSFTGQGKFAISDDLEEDEEEDDDDEEDEEDDDEEDDDDDDEEMVVQVGGIRIHTLQG